MNITYVSWGNKLQNSFTCVDNVCVCIKLANRELAVSQHLNQKLPNTLGTKCKFLQHFVDLSAVE